MIHIDSLSMENFKNCRSAHFRFHDGITVFSGTNGEGKSTVLHAINLLLFNDTVSNLKDYVTWGETAFTVGMDFSIDKHEYGMTFSFSKRGGGTRTLTDKVSGEVYTNNGALDKLGELMNIDRAKASIVSMENEQNLVSTTPSKRREYLKGIYDLEFKEQLDRIDRDLASQSEKLEQVKGQITSLQSQTFDKEMMERPPFRETEYIALGSESKDIEKQLAVIGERKRNRDAICSEIATLNNGIASLESRVVQHDRLIDGLLADVKVQQEGLGRIVDGSDAIREEFKKNYDAVLASMDEKRNAVEECKKSLASLVRPVKPDYSEYTTLSGKVVEYTAHLHMYEKQLEPLKNGICPTCGQPVSSTILDDLKGKIEEVNAEISEYSKKRDDANAVYAKALEDERAYNKDFSSRSIAVKDAEYELSTLNSRKASLEVKQYADLKQEAMRVKSDTDRLNAKIASDDAMVDAYRKQKVELESDILSKRGSLSEKESLLASLGADDDGEGARLNERRSEIEGRMALYEDVAKRNERHVAVNENIDRLEKERDAKLTECNRSMIETSEFVERIGLAKKIVGREFPSYVISRMISTLRDYVNEFLEKVYPKYVIEIEESKDSIKILYGDNKADIKMASGFEKSAFSLAYMYALGKLQSYGLLMIDEGDSTASDENSAKFYDTLGKSMEFFPQIFAITHKEEAKELLRNEYHAEIYTAHGGVYDEG